MLRPQLRAQYQGFDINISGEVEEADETIGAMLAYMGIAILIVYALMAIPFRSYWQPVLILSALPFGLMGAIFWARDHGCGY